MNLLKKQKGENMGRFSKILCVASALLLMVSFASCGSEKAEKETTAQETENVTEVTSTSDDEGQLKNVKYKSFECTGDYYCFDRDNLVNQNKMKFYQKKDSNDDNGPKNYKIIAEYNGKKKEIFNTSDYDYKSYYALQLYYYIDNALYFLAGSSLYRMELHYDESGEIADSEVSLVKKDGYCTPVKAMKNKLILCFFGGKYTELNTVTGEFSDVEYNEPVNGENLDLAVSSQNASKIAFNALKDKNNYETESFEPVSKDFSEYEIVRESGVSPQLFYNPDLMNEHVVHDYYPKYAWKIEFKGNYIADVYVNAETGAVCSVSFNFLD